MGLFAQAESKLHPFTTDGCTMFPDGKWLQCCIEHDKKYWVGGTLEDRKTADQELKKCVIEDSNKVTGLIVYLGVRFGGRPVYSTHFRWGYGWKEKRDYSPLSNEEISITNKYLETTDLSAMTAQAQQTTANSPAPLFKSIELPPEPTATEMMLKNICSPKKTSEAALLKFKTLSGIEVSYSVNVKVDQGSGLQVFSDHCTNGFYIVNYDSAPDCELDQNSFKVTGYGACN